MNALDIYTNQVKVRNLNRDLNCNVNCYIQTKPHSSRIKESAAIRIRFPTKVPVIVERYTKANELPMLDKRKFLVPQELTMSQFLMIIRNRLRLHPSRALFLLVNERSMVSLSKTLSEVYEEHKHLDGFLYVTYASQEVFG